MASTSDPIRYEVLHRIDRPVDDAEMPKLMAAMKELIQIWKGAYKYFYIVDEAKSLYKVKGVYFGLYDGSDEIVFNNETAVLYVYNTHELHVRIGYRGTTFNAAGLNLYGSNVVTFFDGRVEIAHEDVVYVYDHKLRLCVRGDPIHDVAGWIVKKSKDAICPCCPQRPGGGCYAHDGNFSLVTKRSTHSDEEQVAC